MKKHAQMEILNSSHMLEIQNSVNSGIFQTRISERFQIFHF